MFDFGLNVIYDVSDNSVEWIVVYLNEDVRAEVEALSADLQAKFRRIVELIRSKGLERVREPYVKHLRKGCGKCV